MADTWTLQTGVSAAESWFGLELELAAFRNWAINKYSSGYKRSADDDRNTVNITALGGRFTPRDTDEVSPSAP